MGRGQGRGQRNGGKPPPKFPHAAKPPEFPSPKAQRWGGARGEANVMAASRQQNSPTQQSRPNSPPQKRGDGEGPGERPTKWRQAANKIPPRSKAANPRFAADPKQTPPKRIIVAPPQPRALPLRGTQPPEANRVGGSKGVCPWFRPPTPPGIRFLVPRRFLSAFRCHTVFE